MTDHAVVIAGGGPTGLMLAAELALAEVDVVIVEPRADQSVDGSRAGGLYPRTLEVLDQRGVVERFVSAGYTAPALGFGGSALQLADFPSRHNYLLALWQSEFEPILADWVAELGVPTLRRRAVVGFAQNENTVDVNLSDGTTLGSQYLVGCDGGRSTVRKAADIEFAGLEPSTSWLIAQVEMDEEPIVGTRGGGGIGPVNRLEGGNPYGVVLMERELQRGDQPSIEDLRKALVAEYGTDFAMRKVDRVARFTDMARQAVAYRQGRVLLAGDAAHIHPPHGGQGLNTGVQDAVNLGWKLAQVVKDQSSDDLLDTYHAERHPVGARVLHNTMAQVALSRPDDRHRALREIMTDLLRMDEPRRRIAGMVSALDVRYEIGDGHPLLGRRMPDFDIETEAGSTRVFALLHEARPLLVNFGSAHQLDTSSWTARLSVIDASYDGNWELPVLGEVSAPTAVLIRPDGYVAWTGELTDPGLPAAVTRWFG